MEVVRTSCFDGRTKWIAGDVMRLALLVLGLVLIVQALAQGVSPIFQEGFSFQKMGAALDDGLVRLTAGLCAFSVARLLKHPNKGMN